VTIRTTLNGDVEIAYEAVGAPAGEPLLLVMGTGGQMLNWPGDFCRRLADRGFAVARFDNRDTGLSTHLSGAGRPSQLKMLFRPASAAVYRLEDMAGDAVAVLDALDWGAAHIVGVSQGGMIAQTLSIHHPDRVRTLTSISSSPAPRVGRPKPATFRKMLKLANPKRIRSREDMADYMVRLQPITASPAYPADEAWLRELGRQSYDRHPPDVAAVQRHTAAIAASGDRRRDLAGLNVPTLVLHGEDDQMIRVVAGRATADAIPGARLITYPGMGHDLPRPLWDGIIDEIKTLAKQRARQFG
jgi:pimeloyl-ACP methyl ester carboxylesterase